MLIRSSFDDIVFTILKNLNISDKNHYDAVSSANIAIDRLKYHQIKTSLIHENDYPTSLKKITDAPPIIYFKGSLNSSSMAAVVGSRETSKYAKKITNKIVDWLSEMEYGVISGLALGIDTFAHEKAVQNNQYTIAVLPNSLDKIYPNSNYKLANDILEKGGCLISELIFNINRGKKSFVQRNRLQAILSEVVIPVEMGLNSGTNHTINFAKRYKRKIVVMKPTPILKSLNNYSGINELISSQNDLVRLFSDEKSFLKIFKDLDKNYQLDIKFEK